MDVYEDASELFNANLERVVRNTNYPYILCSFQDADVILYPQWSSKRKNMQGDLYTNIPIIDVMNAEDEDDFKVLADRLTRSIERRHFMHIMNFGEVLWSAAHA